MSERVILPTLPSNDGSRLIFDLFDKTQKTFASPELKYALEQGYKITKLYNSFSYIKHT